MLPALFKQNAAMPRERPVAIVFPRVTGTRLPPEACGSAAVAGAGTAAPAGVCRLWTPPRRGVCCTQRLKSSVWPRPGCVSWNSHRTPAPSAPLAETGAGCPFHLGVLLCYPATQSHRAFSGITFLRFIFLLFLVFIITSTSHGCAKESRF